jgi:hypothetical protein
MQDMRWGLPLLLTVAVAGCGRSTLLGFDDGCGGDPACEARLHPDMAGVDLAGRDFAGVDLAGRDFAGVDLAGADLAGRDFAGVDLAGRDFVGVDLAGRDFAGVDLAARDMWRPDLSGVDLAGCVPRQEVCDNFSDDDCDTLVDCQDPDCRTSPACVNMRKEICGNGVDDDGNGLADCADPACFGDRSCITPGQEVCNNGLDDDLDGLIDCADPDCASSPACMMHMGDEICDNGIDDNGDGLVDCQDPKCVAFPACVHFDCVPDVDFGAINPHDSSVTREMNTTSATRTFNTCAPPGGTARVGEFTLTGTADVRLDFQQAAGGAHVVSLYRAGALQACDQNLITCVNAGQSPSVTHTFAALPAGTYRVIVQSYPGTQGDTQVTLSTSPSTKTEICDNGVDDDGNGLVDCADLACAGSPICMNEECNPDFNLGTLVVGAPPKHATFDTHDYSNRYHPTCAGTSTGDDVAVRVTLAETAGIDTWVQWSFRYEGAAGRHTAQVRATDGTGQLQPEERTKVFPSGARGWHQIQFTVE